MAKKHLVSELTDQARTEEKPAPLDRIKARGVGLKLSEWEEIDRIAGELGEKPHYVAAYALRRFLKDYRTGALKPETKKTQTLPDL